MSTPEIKKENLEVMEEQLQKVKDSSQETGGPTGKVRPSRRPPFKIVCGH